MSRQNSTSRTPANRRNRAFLVLGDQLFNPRLLRHYKDTVVLMAEDFRQFSYVKHHKKKLVLMIAAMRSYADELRRSGFEVHYIKLSHANKDKSLLDKLHALLKQNKFKELIHFEIENKHWESQIEKFAAQHGVREKVLQTPMFLSSRSRFAAFLANTTKPKMADFYRQLRTETNILMTKDRGPVGGKWSFDGDNRKKLPANLPVPNMPTLRHSKHVRDAENLVEQLFPQHPGSVEDFQFPVDRKTALKWLDNFLEYRLTNFGHYQDAISDRSPTLFHSVLSPALNLGLITSHEVVHAAVRFAQAEQIEINNIEGFVRQIIGWREFTRGIYWHFDEQQQRMNFWDHQRSLTSDWYHGTTGIRPLDDVIKKTWNTGWAHHIERLMVVGNLMTLCEIHPREAYRWFMEMFVDSADWVMGPNVFGIGIFSDGGLFATKPYICGSNYILKMSDYKSGDWCDVIDGLYWRFIQMHHGFFSKHPRMNMIAKSLTRLAPQRKEKIFAAAEQFLAEKTKSDSNRAA